MSKFKVGDKVRRVSGRAFNRSDLTQVTVKDVDKHGAVYFEEYNGLFSKPYYSGYEVIPNYPNPPHKHAELIKAWADGADIEYESEDPAGKWSKIPNPSWNTRFTYRIALPKPTANEVEKEAILAELAKLQKRLDSLEV